jgi:predicted GNAT family acetyltransferase
MEIRTLYEADRAEVERFLVRHADSSMFLRSNIWHCGFRYRGEHYEADYVAALEAGCITAVIGHAWNGFLLVQAPVQAEELARAAVEASGREVTGFSGPREHVRRARAALGLSDRRCQLDADEDLYSLDLGSLRDPAASDEPITCRAPLQEELVELARWRIAYEVETMGGASDHDEASRAKSLAAQRDAGHSYVATTGAKLLSFSGFNAALPDIVQLGGIYTPPELRGRGYAKHAIASQLTAARTHGVTRAVLFTNNPNAARCYEALGFHRSGQFSLVLLR